MTKQATQQDGTTAHTLGFVTHALAVGCSESQVKSAATRIKKIARTLLGGKDSILLSTLPG